MNKRINLRDLAYFTIVLAGVLYLFYIAKPIVLPLTFGLFMAILLLPIHKRLIKFVKVRWLSIIISFILVLIPFTIMATLISVQLMEIMESLPSIEKSLVSGINQTIKQLNKFVPLIPDKENYLRSDDLVKFMTQNIGWVRDGLMVGSEVLFYIGMTFIYSFFFLLYKDSYQQFIINRYRQTYRPEVKETLHNMKMVIQKYVVGVGIVMVVLAIVNSFGLWVIGVKYAAFWGVLSGLLAVIPYIGTFIGGALPFFFTLATTDTMWQPIAVIGFYTFIQQLEGNIITPKIVGNQVNINPLVSIIGLLVFGMYWGVAGILLALPIISIFKLILEHFELTEPIAKLMGTNLSEAFNENE
jgi:predicted PurR-regulated permease PerM